MKLSISSLALLLIFFTTYSFSMVPPCASRVSLLSSTLHNKSLITHQPKRSISFKGFCQTTTGAALGASAGYFAAKYGLDHVHWQDFAFLAESKLKTELSSLFGASATGYTAYQNTADAKLKRIKQKVVKMLFMKELSYTESDLEELKRLNLRAAHGTGSREIIEALACNHLGIILLEARLNDPK